MRDPDLRILARFLPEFESPDFSPGEWSREQQAEGGAYTMPYVMLSPLVMEFVQASYVGGWVLRDFNWPEPCTGGSSTLAMMKAVSHV